MCECPRECLTQTLRLGSFYLWLVKEIEQPQYLCHKEQSDPCPAHGDQCSHAAVDQVRKLSLATMVSTMVTLEQHEHTIQHLLLPLTPRSVGHTLLERTTPDRESLEPLNICSLLANSQGCSNFATNKFNYQPAWFQKLVCDKYSTLIKLRKRALQGKFLLTDFKLLGKPSHVDGGPLVFKRSASGWGRGGKHEVGALEI